MSETVGQRLRQERLARRLTLEQAADATRIRLVYLQALEDDDFSAMPSPVQGRGFLRLYAQYLGLDIQTLLDQMRQSAFSQVTEVGILPVAEEPVVENPHREVHPPAWRRLLTRALTALSRPRAGTADSEAGSNLQEESPPEGNAAGMEELHPATDPSADSAQAPLPEESVALEQRLSESVKEPEAAANASAEIFAEIGSRLRSRRELLGLALQEVEQYTRVRERHLKAIEAGRMDDLPSPVQARGMLTNYAAFLDLDTEALLLRFAEGLQARHRERHTVLSRRQNNNASRRLRGWQGFLHGDLVFGVFLVVALFVFVIWSAARIMDRQRQTLQGAQAPSISDVLLATSVATSFTQEPTPTLVLEGVAAPIQSATPTLEIPVFTLLPPDIVQVTINVLERTFMRVRVDGEVKFEGRVIPGSAYSFEGKDRIEVATGSGAALHVIYNQKDQGRMGGFGEVIMRIYTRDAVLTPTATPAPTSTATLPPTSRPVQSPTSAPPRPGQ